MRTSVSNSTPACACTRACTCAISSSTSRAVAPAAVDDKPGVLFAHLRAAHAQPLEARRFDERPGEVALGALERRSGAGKIERLLLPAAGVQFLHARKDGRRVVPREAKPRRKHGQAALERQGRSIAHFHFLAGKGDLAAVQQHARLGERVGKLSAVSAGVHRHAAAQRSGNAGANSQPGKPRLLRDGGHARQRSARLGADLLALHPHAGKALAQADHQPAHAAVADNEIGAVAHQQRGQAHFARDFQRPHRLQGAVRQEKHVRRPAHAHGGVGGKRLVLQNLFLQGDGAQAPDEFVDQGVSLPSLRAGGANLDAGPAARRQFAMQNNRGKGPSLRRPALSGRAARPNGKRRGKRPRRRYMPVARRPAFVCGYSDARGAPRARPDPRAG